MPSEISRTLGYQNLDYESILRRMSWNTVRPGMSVFSKSVSCDFSFAIRLISHSVSNSHTLLPKRSIYEKLKVTFGTPV